MILARIFLYVVTGLIVAKEFQKWINKDIHTPPLDMGGFICSIIIWPIPLFILIFVGLIETTIWFYNLGNKK